MDSTWTVPVTVTPEATQRVAELGLQRELQQMIEHTLQTVPGLRAVNVVIALPYDTDDETSVTIKAVRDLPDQPLADRTDSQWGEWKTQTFPPDVCWYIRMMTAYGADHGR
jgi:hypothetical protein